MRFLLVALLFAANVVHAQDVSKLPLYGGFPKTPEMQQADQQLIREMLQTAGTKEDAVELAVRQGWQHLQRGESASAIQRFNQAYLIDAKNANVYWGLGVAVSQQGDFEESLRLFNQAYLLAPRNVRLVADIGLARTRYALKKSDTIGVRMKRLEAALLWFDSAERIDASYPLIYANRAITLTLLSRYKEAWENVDKAESLRKGSVDSNLLAMLNNEAPRRVASADGKTEIKQAVYTPHINPALKTEKKEDSKTPAQPLIYKEEKKIAYTGVKGETKAALVTSSESTRLKIMGSQAAGREDKDKRDCLKLKSNSEIIRCVYPH